MAGRGERGEGEGRGRVAEWGVSWGEGLSFRANFERGGGWQVIN